MKTLKKLFSVSAIVALLGTLAPMYAFGATYTAELEEAYAYAYKNGITTMTSIDNANMFGSLTRIAMAKMIANYATTVLGLEPDTSAKCTFTDVTAALDAQYDNGVTKACQLGLMGQNITAFRPNDPVTRGEFGTTLSRALNANSDDLASMNAADPYYKEHLKFLKEKGIMTQIDNPSMTEVRGYVMLMMMRADESYTPAEGCTAEELLACVTADDYDACIAACSGEEGGEETPTGNGSINVSKVSIPAQQDVAYNAVRQNIGTIKLTAGEYDTTVSSIVVSQNGLSNGGQARIQLFVNGESASSAKLISNSSRTATVKLSPNLVVKAGKSVNVDIVATLIGADVNSTFNFAVTDVNVKDGKSTGTPITLGSLRTTSYQASQLDTDLTLSNVKPGEGVKQLAIVTLTPVSQKAKITNVIISKDSGNTDLDDVFENVTAYYNNNKVGTVNVSDDTITINGLDITADAGEAVTLIIKAENKYVGDATTFDLTINDTDVMATEVSTNQNIYSNGCTVETFTIGEPKITIKKISTGDQTVAPKTNSVELLNVKVESKAEFEVIGGSVSFVDLTTFDFADFTNGEVTVWVDGTDYVLDNTNTEVAFSKNDSFEVSPSHPVIIRATANIASNATLTDEIQMAVEITDLRNIADNNSILTLTSPVSKNGDTTTINNGTYTITKGDTPNNKTIKANDESDVLFFRMNANAENQVLQNVYLTTTYGGTLSDIVEEITLVGENDEWTITDETEIDALEFLDLGYSLPKGDTQEFSVKVALKSLKANELGDDISFSVDSVDVTKTDNLTYTTTTSTLPVAGTIYQIAASSTPSIKVLSSAGKNTKLQISNSTNYDVNILSLKVAVNRAYDEGTATFINWEGDLDLLTSIGGTALAPRFSPIPGEATFALSDDFIVGSSAEEMVLTIVAPGYSINNGHYEVEVLEATFEYIDRENNLLVSAPITESYAE